MNPNLPEYYKKWLRTLDFENEIEYSGNLFYLYSERELEEIIEIDRDNVKACDQLSIFIKTQLAFSGISPILKEDCKNCVTIGDKNGNPVFFNSSKNYELSCYYLDGGYIESLGGNLLELVRNGKNT